MTDVLLLDLLLMALLIGYVIYGFSSGLSRSAFVIAGVVAGVVASFFLTPLVTNWVPWAWIRPGVTVATLLILVAAGHALGSAIGRAVRRGIAKTALSGLDRVLGALVTGVAAALIAAVVGTSVGQLGFPALSRAIAGSTVLRTINTLTPDPVEAWVAQLKSLVATSGIPVISDAFAGKPPAVPQLDTGSAALNTAAASVVRITGNAYACGVSQSGTGFVVADDRVVTNAHVVAGVAEPVVEAPNGEAIAGYIVYFDPIDDLAVIAVPGLSAAPLRLGTTLSAGADAAVQGYPFGGPFTAGGAEVVRVSVAQVENIYGTSTQPREVYTLAADVLQGNSGGPLLALDGSVTGVVFAKSADTDHVGYAMTMAELNPVASQAAGLDGTVSTGECIGN
ncbi:MAG: MarP family serine protease [Rhodoglobus sp.]|nr:MarP family serine protease [Rhodoglobus sp.]